MTKIGSRDLAGLSGELVVIVLGVLLALAADRWNERRVEVQTAESYAERILAELVADSARLEVEREASAEAARSGVSLLGRVRGGEEAPERTYQLYYGCVRSAPLPYAGGATFREVQSAGDLALLDESVRQSLFDYYGYVDSQLLRLQDFRRIGRDPITEVALRTGAWLPEGERPSDDELLARFRMYPDIDEIVMSCTGFQQTTAGVLRQWTSRLSEVLVVMRTAVEDS